MSEIQSYDSLFGQLRAETVQQEHDISAEALREMIDLEGNERFIRSLLEKVELPEKEIAFIGERLDALVSRAQDDRVFLGVVGEFSCGKSTLINGLLRDSLLKADVLQSTTSATTIIEYGARLKCTVYMQDGGSTRMKADHRRKASASEQLVGFIQDNTANEKTASRVARVRIEHPAELLKTGVVIVDTPGTNSLNDRHTEVTRAAIRDICDAAMIVIPAITAGAESLVSFAHENLEEVLHRCFFVLTKTDLLRNSREEERVMKTLEARLKTQLGLERRPPILPMCAPYILYKEGDDPPHRRLTEEMMAGYREQFVTGEQTIIGRLRHQRRVVQAERISAILSEVMNRVEEQVVHLEASSKEACELLESNRVRKLSSFINQRCEKWHRENQRLVMDARETLKQSMAEEKRKFVYQLCEEIGRASDTTELDELLSEKKLRKHIGILKGKITRLTKKTFNYLHEENGVQQKSFEEAFSAEYAALNILASQSGIRVGKEGRRIIGGSHDMTEELLSSRADGLDTDGRGVIFSGGGAVAGAVIGSFIFPGIGTIVGGWIGTIVGGLFGPELSEVKEKYRKGVRDSMNTSFTKMKKEVEKALQEFEVSAARHIDGEAAAYIQTYHEVVENVRKDTANEETRLQALRKDLGNTKNEVKARQTALSIARQQLQRIDT